MAHVLYIVRTPDMGNGYLEGFLNLLQITHINITNLEKNKKTKKQKNQNQNKTKQGKK